MPLFLITRDVPGITQEEMDAAAYRAITCAFNYDGLTWWHSYWDKQSGVLHCVYEAQSAEDIFEHAQAARIPCDEVREVEQFGPVSYTGEEVTQLART